MLMHSLVSVAPALMPDFLDPEHLIESFGTAAIVGIVALVFIETGLLFPLLPGDSLLFTAGALVAQDQLHIGIGTLCAALFLAAFAGDQTAYWIGRRLGPRLFDRPDSKIFKREWIDQTHTFFLKHGGKAVVLARFVPIVRTYSAVAAGVGRMHYRTFVLWDLLGALLWGVGVTLLGYALGNVGFIKDNIELLLIVVVLVSVVPVGLELLRKQLKARRAPAAAPVVVEPVVVDGVPQP